nr:unnamed protein product [Digitaria exilis]
MPVRGLHHHCRGSFCILLRTPSWIWANPLRDHRWSEAMADVESMAVALGLVPMEFATAVAACAAQKGDGRHGGRRSAAAVAIWPRRRERRGWRRGWKGARRLQEDIARERGSGSRGSREVMEGGRGATA